MRIFILAALAALPVMAQDQGLTKSDSGWVPLFNGRDFAGLYSRCGSTATPSAEGGFTILNTGTDSAEIRVATQDGEPCRNGWEIGAIRNDYGRYRMRLQYRFAGISPEWNDLEVVKQGSDSLVPGMDGLLVFAGAATHITGSQVASTAAHIRRWEIMELPEDGPDFLQRLILAAPSQPTDYTAGSVGAITWKSIGEILRISVWYDVGAGDGWVMVADNIENTGSYAWPVPDEPSTHVRFKVSAAPWVRADSTLDDNRIVIGTGMAKLDPRAGRGSGPGEARGNASGGIRWGGLRDLKGRTISATPMSAPWSSTARYRFAE